MKLNKLLSFISIPIIASNAIIPISSCSCQKVKIKVLNDSMDADADGTFLLKLSVPHSAEVTSVSVEGAKIQLYGSGDLTTTSWRRTEKFYKTSFTLSHSTAQNEYWFWVDTHNVPNGEDLSFSLKMYYGGGYYEANAINIKIRSHSSYFFTADWGNIVEYANQGLDKLKEHYGIDNFVGLQRKINLFGKELTVRVIGTEHDTIADGSGKKAALTFDLADLVTNDIGYPKTITWKSDNSTCDYLQSELKQALNSTTDVGSFGKSCLTALKEENQTLAPGIKTVTKLAWDSATYNDALFPLSLTEMDVKPSQEEPGQSAYPFYVVDNGWSLREKGPVDGNVRDYWVESIYDKEGESFGNKRTLVLSDYSDVFWSHVHPQLITNTAGISFAFCI